MRARVKTHLRTTWHRQAEAVHGAPRMLWAATVPTAGPQRLPVATPRPQPRPKVIWGTPRPNVTVPRPSSRSARPAGSDAARGDLHQAHVQRAAAITNPRGVAQTPVADRHNCSRNGKGDVAPSNIAAATWSSRSDAFQRFVGERVLVGRVLGARAIVLRARSRQLVHASSESADPCWGRARRGWWTPRRPPGSWIRCRARCRRPPARACPPRGIGGPDSSGSIGASGSRSTRRCTASALACTDAGLGGPRDETHTDCAWTCHRASHSGQWSGVLAGRTRESRCLRQAGVAARPPSSRFRRAAHRRRR